MANEPSGKLGMYIFNLTWASILLNVALFPGLAWLFYHKISTIHGAVVATEMFFGGLICTMIIGITSHLETTNNRKGCFACHYRGNCPFLGIFILGIVLGVVSVTASHLYFGNADVSFRSFLWGKSIQGFLLGVIIPFSLVKLRLLLHPEVIHGIDCPTELLAKR